ncbi:MAG: PD-(D/E)XK nuclease family protein [Actinomycetaceae bacterium]|nr:PD-(D/E)XK nuclease family protein [Actinomycetaceae bacterium]
MKLQSESLRLAVRSKSFGELDEANTRVVSQIVEGDGAVVVRGAPGSGRTSVAIAVARGLREKLGGDVFVITPDRLRADLLQRAGELALPGVVRPVRTPIALAYAYASKWYVERENPLPAPQLLTGAMEDSEVAQAIEEGVVQWPESVSKALQMPEFRMEIRNLMARTREAGFDGAQLEELGRRFGREIWVSTGQLMQVRSRANEARQANAENVSASAGENESDAQATAELEPPLFESAAFQEHAARIIRDWNEKQGEEGVFDALEVPSAVVVDDLQDCTRATLSLLEALASAGTRVVVTADSDVAVSVYRGGEPHLDGQLIERLGANVVNLGPTHRGNQSMRYIVQRVTERTTVQHDAQHRLQGSVDPREDSSGLSVKTYGSFAQESNAIARTIMRYQLGVGPGIERPVPLSEQAVIVRNSADVQRIRFGLLRNGIETTVRRRAIVYASDPTASMLLLLLVPITEGLSEGELFDRLLRSPLVNAHTTKLRKVSDIFKVRIGGAESMLHMAEVLASDEEGVADLKQHIAKVGLADVLGDLTRAFELLKLGRKVRESAPQQALWELWKTADVEESWTKRALQPGADSAIYDERLDAVVSLFRTADVWSQRRESDTAEDFALEILAQRIPSDTLAPTGKRPLGVQVLTVADAIGQEWDVVYIASMQDGKWPNLALRDRISYAGDVTELSNIPKAEWNNISSWNTGQARRKSALTTEYRQLAAAVSRAKHALHISAVQNEEDAPSQFVYKLALWTGTGLIEGVHLPVTPVDPGVDTRSLVASLRQKVAMIPDETQRQNLAVLLALLAESGVEIANPNHWNGVGGLTTSEPIVEGMPTLSPSQLETLVKCPARWFLTRHGGSVPANVSIMTGNLIHKIAEETPEATFDEQLEKLSELWDDEEFDRETTLGKAHYEDTVTKLERLSNYLQQWKGKHVDLEMPIFQEVDIDGVKFRIAGRIDRLEHTEDGVVVTDIKTGFVGTQKDTKKHLQLAAYQFALQAMGFDVHMARLLALKEKDPTKYVQPGLFKTPPSEAPVTASGEEGAPPPSLRDELARTITSAVQALERDSFPARPDENYCAHCPVKNSCPAKNEGERTLK